METKRQRQQREVKKDKEESLVSGRGPPAALDPA